MLILISNGYKFMVVLSIVWSMFNKYLFLKYLTVRVTITLKTLCSWLHNLRVELYIVNNNPLKKSHLILTIDPINIATSICFKCIYLAWYTVASVCYLSVFTLILLTASAQIEQGTVTSVLEENVHLCVYNIVRSQLKN